jgi:hypothetical protein
VCHQHAALHCILSVSGIEVPLMFALGFALGFAQVKVTACVHGA